MNLQPRPDYAGGSIVNLLDDGKGLVKRPREEMVFHFPHFTALMIAAAVTPLAVALLSYPLASVFGARGLVLVALCSGGLSAACYFGRVFVPPAPMVPELPKLSLWFTLPDSI